jgi:L-rhamnono-1,4-lactonase
MATSNGPADYPIIDSHIHLYPKAELDTLALCKPTGLLYAQYSVDGYDAATASPSSLDGFIFLETDRKHDLHTGAADGGRRRAGLRNAPDGGR